MELFKASEQWFTRPADQRFASIEAMHVACSNYRHQARTAELPYREMCARAEGKELIIDGKTTSARLSNWAFGQLAQRAEAPASYMRQLPAFLAADCINHGLQKKDGVAQLMFHSNGSLLMRSITSDKYERIWNSDITKRLLALTKEGWRLPPARPAFANQPGTRIATEADVLGNMGGGGGLSVKVGDEIAPAGAYASDHDMFVFLVDPTRSIQDPSGQVLYRGFFTWNSEVGAASFGIQTFLFRHVCGNHIVWDASGVKVMRIRHVGEANERSREMLAEVYKYRDSAASDDEAKLKLAATKRLGTNKEEVLDALFKMRLPVSQAVCKSAVDCAEECADVDGDPYSVWGTVNGLTRISQRGQYTDERVFIDRAAAKVMEVAF